MLKSSRKSIVEILGRSPVHPFPARMAPGIALDALDVIGEGRSLHVLDPMVGSGTVLAVARSKGHRTYGVDLDPLAVLLAKVWTSTVEPNLAREQAQLVLDSAKSIFRQISSRESYPNGCDEETREFARFWFDGYARRQLAALSETIRYVQDKLLQDLLWCAFSRLIITKKSGASLAMDLSHSRPHKKFDRAPAKPFTRFLSAVETVLANCPQKKGFPVGPPSCVRLGDARQLDQKSQSIDVVLSSPPYLNAIDYIRCSKFSLIWMGYTIADLRAIRARSVGAELGSAAALDVDWVAQVLSRTKLNPALSAKNHKMLARYTFDMGLAICEASRVLKTSGTAVYVVGDSTLKGTFVRNSSIVRSLAEINGLKLISQHSRTIPNNRRYLPPPKEGTSAPLDSRMRKEVVLVFEKTLPNA